VLPLPGTPCQIKDPLVLIKTERQIRYRVYFQSYGAKWNEVDYQGYQID
jgi:hypothetical protein